MKTIFSAVPLALEADFTDELQGRSTSIAKFTRKRVVFQISLIVHGGRR